MTTATAHINRIATAVPAHDIHGAFVRFARTLLDGAHARAVFDRVVARGRIAHRFSVLPAAPDPEGASVDAHGVYARGRFPTTAERMQLFEKHAPTLAMEAVGKLDLGSDAKRITHVIVTSCTGMSAPGLDLELVERCGLDPSVERTMVGFMGCYAALNALKLARHIVRSAPESRVLMLNLELCSLHLQAASSLEDMLSFLVFGDGAAASLVSAEGAGVAIDSFRAVLVPDTRPLITWKVRDQGFDMFLSSRVPPAIARGLEGAKDLILGGASPEAIELWAVHPGGHAVLDAVEHGLQLREGALAASRSVLEQFGNMSSPTVMFVLQSLMEQATAGQRGCAMSFGPGLTAESMLFHKV